MKKVLFICQGNVGRSQIAEGFFNHLQDKYLGISAGIDDVGVRYNYKPFPPIIDIMQEKYDIDIGSHRVRKLQKNDINDTQAIVLLCHQSECINNFPGYLTEQLHLLRLPVEDPHNKNQCGIVAIINDIYAIVIEIIKGLNHGIIS